MNLYTCLTIDNNNVITFSLEENKPAGESAFTILSKIARVLKENLKNENGVHPDKELKIQAKRIYDRYFAKTKQIGDSLICRSLWRFFGRIQQKEDQIEALFRKIEPSYINLKINQNVISLELIDQKQAGRSAMSELATIERALIGQLKNADKVHPHQKLQQCAQAIYIGYFKKTSQVGDSWGSLRWAWRLFNRIGQKERRVASLYRRIQAISWPRLHDLPKDPLLLICSFLPLSDIKALRGVNKMLRLRSEQAIIQRAERYGYCGPDLNGSREDLEKLLIGDKKILSKDLEKLLKEDLEKLLKEDLEKFSKEEYLLEKFLLKSVLEYIEKLSGEDFKTQEDIEKLLSKYIKRLPKENFEKLLSEYIKQLSREHLKMLYKGLQELWTGTKDPVWIKKKSPQPKSPIDYHATLEYLRLKSHDTIDQLTTDWIRYMSDQDDRYTRSVATNEERYKATLLSLCFGLDPKNLDPKKYPHILTSETLIGIKDGILQYIDDRTISLLIAYGADPLHISEKNEESLWSILCKSQIKSKAAYLIFESVCQIVSKKSAIDDNIASDKQGRTPLRLAIYKRDVEKFRILLECGADPNKKVGGYTPLFYLFGQNLSDLQMLRLLVANKKTVIDDSEEWLPKTPLTAAISSGALEIAKCLLEGGADPNRKDQNGKSPFDYACALCNEGASNDCTVLKLLLKYGAAINSIYPGVPTLVGFLRANPPPTKIKISRTTTIEISSEKWHERRLPFFKLLCEKGVDINAQEEVSGNSPLHIAYSDPALQQFIPTLLEWGANTELLNAKKQKPCDCAPLIKKK